jgi:hypothetical protein
MGWCGLDWSGSGYHGEGGGGSCECGNEPSGSIPPYHAGKLSSGYTAGGLSSSRVIVTELDVSIKLVAVARRAGA